MPDAGGDDFFLLQAVVVPGDVRTACDRDARLINVADRVSLGLLPSSRVGWEPAVRFLRSDGRGGWLHVHENLPVESAEEFGERVLVPTLSRLFQEVKGRTWEVRVEKVVRVKSFAPKIDHFVFDVRCDDVNGVISSSSSFASSLATRDDDDAVIASEPQRLAMRRAKDLVIGAFDILSCEGSHEGEEGRRKLREMMEEVWREMRLPDR